MRLKHKQEQEIGGGKSIGFSLFHSRYFQFIGVGLLFLFFVLPIARLMLLSVSSEQGLTLQHYVEVLQEKATWKTLQNTVYLVVGSTLISSLLGVVSAWVIAYTNVRRKRLIEVFIFLPFIIPSYITTLAWTQLFSPNGWVAAILQLIVPFWSTINIYSLTGIITVMGISHFPLVYLLTVNALRKIPRELEQAAQVSGAKSWRAVFTVTFPLAFPGIISGGFLAFLASLDNFGVPAFLGIPANIRVLSTYIYEQIVGFGPSSFARAATLSVMLGVIALIGTVIQWLFLKKSKQLEAPYVDLAPRYVLNRKWRWGVECLLWSFLLFVSVVPLISMFAVSFIKAYGLSFSIENISLKNYSFILLENEKAKTAMWNSVSLAFVTMLLCLVLGTAVAYSRARKPTLLIKSGEILIGLPYALPGTVLALAMIFTWMEPIPGWNPGIYGSVAILYIAYVTRFLILQVRGSLAAFMQVEPAVEEAAQVSGTNGFYKWKQILLPLVFPGVASGAFLVFLSALTELTVSSLLWSSGSETIGLVIFNFEQAGYTTYSTAFSSVIVILIGCGFMMLTFFRKFWRKRGRSFGNSIK